MALLIQQRCVFCCRVQLAGKAFRFTVNAAAIILAVDAPFFGQVNALLPGGPQIAVVKFHAAVFFHGSGNLDDFFMALPL